MGAGPTQTLVDGCTTFLADRLREELALLWQRDRPGAAAQVAILDELLVAVAAGGLPATRDLRILLHGYGDHPAYDPGWTSLLDGPAQL